jgi:hypothetical protein
MELRLAGTVCTFPPLASDREGLALAAAARPAESTAVARPSLRRCRPLPPWRQCWHGARSSCLPAAIAAARARPPPSALCPPGPHPPATRASHQTKPGSAGPQGRAAAARSRVRAGTWGGREVRWGGQQGRQGRQGQQGQQGQGAAGTGGRPDNYAVRVGGSGCTWEGGVAVGKERGRMLME